MPENVCVICQPLFPLCFFVLTDEVDEIEVYGSEAQSGTQLATYSFEVKKINTWQNLSCLLCLCMKLTEGCVFTQVCDSILNIGPCAMASMGEPAFLSEEVQTVKRFLMSITVFIYSLNNCILRFLTLSSPQFQSNPEPDLEVVVCSGYGKNGALSVLQVIPMFCYNARVAC